MRSATPYARPSLGALGSIATHLVVAAIMSFFSRDECLIAETACVAAGEDPAVCREQYDECKGIPKTYDLVEFDLPEPEPEPEKPPEPEPEPEKIPYAVERYTNETKRLYGVMNKRLAKSKYLGGPAYSIADIAVFPWLRSWKNQGIDWNDYPHLRGWFDEVAARPAVKRGVEVLADLRKPITGDKEREILFGKRQVEQR